LYTHDNIYVRRINMICYAKIVKVGLSVLARTVIYARIIMLLTLA